MSEPELIDGPFAAFLEANRGAINHAVAAAVRQSSGFDAAAFGAVLRTTVAPIVDAVDALGEGFVTLVSQTLFDVALDLCVQRRFEGAVRHGWDRLLPLVARALAADPARVVAAVTNALDSLDRTDGARPAQWIDLLAAAAPHAPHPDDLLAAGQVAAWRSGMAAYRSDALAMAGTLDPDLAAAALGMPARGWAPATFLARLRDDPWFDPAAAPGPEDGTDTVTDTDTDTVTVTVTDTDVDERAPVAVGSFRGFGGPFLRPPTITVADGRVVATDGEDTWFVFADAFGWAVLRAPGPSVAPAAGRPASASTEPPPPEAAGIPEVTGWARIPSGLVATSALAHAVLFTRPRRP